MELVRKTNIREFICIMCKKWCLGQSQYILKTHEVGERHLSEELEVCTKCIIRETIFKKKQDVDEYLLGK